MNNGLTISNINDPNFIEEIPKVADKKTKNETIIVAPHPDDEIIGCYEILTNYKIRPVIIYTANVDNNRRQEALKLKEYIGVRAQLFLNSIPSEFLHPSNIFYFPHPIYENHPEHRLQGFAGEQLARAGFDVTFYITEMNAPFKYECKTSNDKKDLLNKCYPNQCDLWKYDYKYFLFSGYDKWSFI